MDFFEKLGSIIRKPKKGIFEISRGKKLLDEWYYYILKYDFSNEKNPFVLIEIIRDKLISKINLNLTEIKSNKYSNFIISSNSKKEIKEYDLNKAKTIRKWYLESKSLEKFNGNCLNRQLFLPTNVKLIYFNH